MSIAAFSGGYLIPKLFSAGVTYFPRLAPSIIGPTRFHFSVRNGKRWDTRQ